MCSHYQTLKDAELLLKKFGAPNKPASDKYDVWPRRPSVFIRRPIEHDAGDEAVPEREVVVGRWGLISAMTKADGLDKARQAVDVQRPQRDRCQVLHLRQRSAPGPALDHPSRRHLRTRLEVRRRSGHPVHPSRRRAAGHRRSVGSLAQRRRPAAGELHHADDQLRPGSTVPRLPPGRQGKADGRHPTRGRLRRLAHRAGGCDTEFPGARPGRPAGGPL